MSNPALPSTSSNITYQTEDNAETSNRASLTKNPLEFLRLKHRFGERKTRDGQPAKRRGPKPDSKPAINRRQELNRQAQRSHRDRKERYMRELENEVLRFKELFIEAERARDDDQRWRENLQAEVAAVQEENRQLRETLARQNIHSMPPNSGAINPKTSTNAEEAATGQASDQKTPAIAAASLVRPPTLPGGESSTLAQAHSLRESDHQLDYDEIGLDFVGTLEHPCMEHKQYLQVRSYNGDLEYSGHVLMATSVPLSHIESHPDVPYPHRLPELPRPSLIKMLHISMSELPLRNNEVTPVQAWAGIISHPNAGSLTKEDFDTMKSELALKVHCYGFGAVLEDFEVIDALTRILTSKFILVGSAEA